MTSEMRDMRDGAAVYIEHHHPPTGDVKGVIQFVHGFGEHTGRYAELAGRFTDKGFAFVIHDQRGHGQTPGKRGVAPRYGTFLDDLDCIRDGIGVLYPGAPVFLYGHSMGGNISLSYLLERSQERHAAAVIGSPWLRLYKPFPLVVKIMASMLGKVSPRLSATNKLLLETLTHDPEIIGAVKNDLAYHSTLSLRLFSEITRQGELAIENAARLKLPALLLCAGQDKVVCPLAINRLAANNGGITLISYPEQYHELHNELNRADVFDDVYQFIISLTDH